MKNIALGTHFQGLNRQFSFKGLLDIYEGAAAAYSLRKLSKATTSVVRVRRDSDNAEADFTALEITDGTLEAWVNTEYTLFDEDFTTDVGWTLDPLVTISGGTLNFVNSNATTAAFEGYGGVPNQRVRVTYTILDYVSGVVRWQNYGGGQVGIARSANGTYVEEVTNSAGNQNWGFNTTNFTGKIDNFKVEVFTADGLVTTWYDQSGNGNDATQGSASSQPKIVSAGVLVTENGKPAVDFSGTSSTILIVPDDSSLDFLTGFTFFTVQKPDTLATSFQRIIAKEINSNGYNIGYATNRYDFDIRVTDGNLGTVTTDRELTTWVYNGSIGPSSLNVYSNGTLVVNTSTADSLLPNTEALAIAGRPTGAVLFDGKIQEIILHPYSTISSRSGIEANINKAFNIYWDGTQKGLLDTYTGAEAAYSLRALNSAYTGAILRVRRASDNAEQDIYAKWDGTLNVEALETFCAATDGYVVTWYDQSGNANNATQATAASQPQIVSSGSIITDSGYQVIQYDGSDDNLGTSFTATGTMLMGGADGGAFYEVAVSGGYNLLASAGDTDHPLKESIRVIWGRTLSAGEQSAIESRVTYSDWDFSDVTSFLRYWRLKTELTSFPLIDTSNGLTFISAWYNCNSLTSFPALDVSSGTNFFRAWQFCASLQDFPANMFDSVTATDFSFAFANTNLTQTSIDNILVSLDTAGQSGGTFNQSGGSAPSATGEAAIDNLRAKGWTVTVTGGY